jgi:hypothetical protein
MKIHLQHLTKNQLQWLVSFSLKHSAAAEEELNRRENRGA